MSSLRVVRDDDTPFFGLIGAHPAMLALFDSIRRAACLDVPVVICGPTGSGKELVARALHRVNGTRGGPFCPVNVAALPEGLVESELFGSTRGAFTSAVADRRGLIEAAAGGTLLLDEASDLPAGIQAKLLRVLEYGEIRRVGAAGTVTARFRLVVAAQDDPAALRDCRQWREDFYYRVTGIVLRVPSLSQRASDIPLLARAFIRAQELPDVEPAGMALLEQHAFPGNVRELQHTLIRAAYHAHGDTIREASISAALEDSGHHPPAASVPSLRSVRVDHVRRVVDACGGDTQRAAELLGISRSQVYRILGQSSSPRKSEIRVDANTLRSNANAPRDAAVADDAN